MQIRVFEYNSVVHLGKTETVSLAKCYGKHCTLDISCIFPYRVRFIFYTKDCILLYPNK